MAEQGEACSSVHLARDPFGLGVDALSGAVAVREREPGDHGVDVPVQVPGEGCSGAGRLFGLARSGTT